MLHLSAPQYRFILDVFDEQTFGHRGDLETEMEVVGAGLDASLQVGAVGYDGRHGHAYAFYRVELLTFVDGGTAAENDFDPERFIDLYRQAS